MGSEVALIREKIAAEYMAAKWGLQGLAQGTSRHDFITRRMESIDAYHEKLCALVGEQAIVMVAETIESMPEKLTRPVIRKLLLHEQGDTEDTQMLLDYLADMWETINLLVLRFGTSGARLVIDAPVQ